jgi:hypothetical protein
MFSIFNIDDSSVSYYIRFLLYEIVMHIDETETRLARLSLNVCEEYSFLLLLYIKNKLSTLSYYYIYTTEFIIDTQNPHQHINFCFYLCFLSTASSSPSSPSSSCVHWFWFRCLLLRSIIN